MYACRNTRAGQSRLPIVIGVLLIAALVLMTVPTVEHRRQTLERQQCIESLTRVAMAKARYASDRDLKAGAPVSLEDLIKDAKILTEPPALPAGTELTVNLIGELPTCVYRGEKLNPLIDYRPTATADTAGFGS